MRIKKPNRKLDKKLLPVNHQIKALELVLIDEQTGKREQISKAQALVLAQEQNLDLVLVAPKANPPVAKILDYGKYRYELKRQDRKRQQKKRTDEIKEIRLSVRMEQHDLDQRLKRAGKFLQSGHRVMLSLRFRGRENIFKNKGLTVLNDFANKLAVDFEQPPKITGNRLNGLLNPKLKNNHAETGENQE